MTGITHHQNQPRHRRNPAVSIPGPRPLFDQRSHATTHGETLATFNPHARRGPVCTGLYKIPRFREEEDMPVNIPKLYEKWENECKEKERVRSQPLVLTYGVEIETAIKLQVGTYPEGLVGRFVREDMEQCLRDIAVPVQELRGDAPLAYEFWTINSDPSIKRPPNTDTIEYDEAEIQTRILHHDNPESARELRQVLESLTSQFTLLATPEYKCGVHVHIGNEGRGFPWPVLHRYALLLVAFEHLLLELVPEHRFHKRGRPFAKWAIPPSRNSELRKFSPELRQLKIWKCRWEFELTQYMSPFMHGKNSAFNFGSLRDRSKKTIEHRLFPGTTDPDEILSYVDLCASMMKFAWRTPDEDMLKLLPSAFDETFGLEQFFAAIGQPGRWETFKYKLFVHNIPWFKRPTRGISESCTHWM